MEKIPFSPLLVVRTLKISIEIQKKKKKTAAIADKADKYPKSHQLWRCLPSLKK